MEIIWQRREEKLGAEVTVPSLRRFRQSAFVVRDPRLYQR